ncbi:conserved exported hypothetical protein [Candidatus Sulfotelmatomonas gaucii]|uniref:DUF4440 domain-containing protein n=1 Tax=Candidatus Sulfuritelmatomonas gaucii TaxID=2043161 RepID=A0A2N9LLV6_9BACT|nr:conserved exported hypothetical protein [Candidatus Sulfotelmatomonas gaucii]
MLRSLLVLCASFAAASGIGGAQADVQVSTAHLNAPRPLNDETRSAAIRDYLEAWQGMSEALAQNRTDLLDADFVGGARDRLANTVQNQAALGLSTRYQDRSHNIQVLFYSPEGLSIELADTAEYEVQVFDHGKQLTSQTETARYIVVLTPSEVRWRVRVFQAVPD